MEKKQSNATANEKAWQTKTAQQTDRIKRHISYHTAPLGPYLTGQKSKFKQNYEYQNYIK
jgi:hypothetical protein